MPTDNDASNQCQPTIEERLRERHRVDSNRMWPAPSDLDLEAAEHIRELEEALQLVAVFKVEGDADVYVSICGVKLLGIKSGRPAERALLKFDAVQRAALSRATTATEAGDTRTPEWLAGQKRIHDHERPDHYAKEMHKGGED